MMDYRNIQLRKYYELKKVIESDMDDIDMQVNIIALLNDMEVNDVYNLPLDDYAEKVGEIMFLSEPPKPRRIKIRTSEIKINGKKYTLLTKPEKMTAGQYIDYQTCLKNKLGFEYILSCLLIPDGKKYGEYDYDGLVNDILDLDIQSCIDICFFFRKRLLSSIRDSLIYSDLEIRRAMRKAPKEKRMELRKEREKIHHKISEINGIGSIR